MDKRRNFSREFKFAAVRKVIEQGLSYAAVGRDLGVGANLIRNWKKTFREVLREFLGTEHSWEASRILPSAPWRLLERPRGALPVSGPD